MRNYVIINGKSTKELRGIMVNELPPITKPSIRTQVEQIDGRDGDIITKLGYASYDKTITIGLFGGGYDVDEIIAFFNSEGTITFSNEEDKFYYFTMVSQLDIESLLRFKTASITFHCQPFKYSTIRFEENFPVATKSFTVFNQGNIYSKPIYEITGTGTINLSIDGTQRVVIDLGESSKTITIDTEKLDAYDSNNLLVNRSITGDYTNLFLNVGYSTITWSGTITSFKLKKATRWL